VLLRRCLSVILICSLLVACASSKLAQDLQAGKASFESGSYKEAFRQLLPIAVKGKPEAQYAVGYMYYYGYGVSEDGESGLFWMTKAAEQNYPPAIKALHIIQHPTAETESFVPVRQSSRSEDRRDEVIRTMHNQNPPDVPAMTAAPATNNNMNNKKISELETVTTPPSEPVIKIATSQEEKQDLGSEKIAPKYALQLFGDYHLDSVKELQLQLRLKNTGHIYQTTHEGKDWYVLTFGNFITSHEALATQHNLPGELKKMHPWVRNVDELHLV